MIKKTLSFAVFLALTFSLKGQVLVGVLGDYGVDEPINYRMDNLPSDIDLGVTGNNNIWNFSHLRSPVQYPFTYQDASKGMYQHLFDNSDYMLLDPWGVEYYYQKTGDNLKLVGNIQFDKGNNNPLIQHFISPLLIVNKDANLERKYSGQFEMIIESWENAFLQENGLERVKIVGEIEVRRSKDATGVMYLPGEVLNVSRSIIKSTTELQVLQWNGDDWAVADLDLLTSMNLNIPFYSEEYHYKDLKTDQIACVVYMNKFNQVESVMFRSSDIENIKTYDNSSSQEFILHPTVSFGDIRLDFLGFAPGAYELEVFSILGAKIWTNTYHIAGDITFKEDFGSLAKGHYQYTLRDKNGNRILTRRFAIIKP